MRWITRISIVIGLGALVTTVWLVGFGTIAGHLRAIGWFFIVLLAIDVASSLLDATAIYFMAYGKNRPSWRQSVVALFAGRGVNAVTPGGNLGEALKVSLLARECSPRRAVAAVMYAGGIAIVMQFAMITIGTAATAFLFDMPRPATIAILVGACVAATIAIGIPVLFHRGMLSTFANVLARLRLVSRKRRQKWTETLEEIDDRLRGLDDGEHRNKAIACVAVSQALQKVLTYVTVLAAGYELSAAQFLALVSAGVLLAWISTIVPMGIGISEGGHVALFTLIGAPPALGVALALARRVNQVMFASIGFVVLTTDRLAVRVRHQWKPTPT